MHHAPRSFPDSIDWMLANITRNNGCVGMFSMIDFGSPAAEYYWTKIEAPFFAYCLEYKGALVDPEATVRRTTRATSSSAGASS